MKRSSFVLLLATVVGLLGLGTPFLGVQTQLRAQTASGTTVTYSPGWNLVGGPPGSVLTDAAGSLYTFQAIDTSYESFPANSQIQGDIGYWAYFPTSTTVSFATSTGGALTILLPAGHYIMVGNPFTQPVTLTGEGQALVYNPAAGSYQAASSLNVGQGAWVFAQNGGVLTLTPRTSTTPTATPTATRSPSPTATPAAGT